MIRPITIAASLALAACSAAAEPEAQETAAPESADPDVDAAAQSFYQPYTLPFEESDNTADWDRPIFSASLRKLIGEWKTTFSDEEVADLQDFGWLCECQDWDSESFKVTIEPHSAPAGNQAEVPVRVAIGWDEVRSARLSLVREGDAWLIDDIRSEAFPQGLRAALAQAIAERGAGGA
jgi:hypothetical protein